MEHFEFFGIFLFEKLFLSINQQNLKIAEKCKNFAKNGVYDAFFAKKTVGKHYFFCDFFIIKYVLDPKKGPNRLKLLFFEVSHKNFTDFIFLLSFFVSCFITKKMDLFWTQELMKFA